MLRASGSEFDLEVELRGVTDPTVSTGVPAGTLLVTFVDALLGEPEGALDVARAELAAAIGPGAAAMTAAVVANFEMMNRILDATGGPTPRRRTALAEELGIDPTTFGHGHGALTVDTPPAP